MFLLLAGGTVCQSLIQVQIQDNVIINTRQQTGKIIKLLILVYHYSRTDRNNNSISHHNLLALKTKNPDLKEICALVVMMEDIQDLTLNEKDFTLEPNYGGKFPDGLTISLVVFHPFMFGIRPNTPSDWENLYRFCFGHDPPDTPRLVSYCHTSSYNRNHSEARTYPRRIFSSI